jgi:signal transduction histidine kinase
LIPHSIRRRLPLSYAAIALVAALALGAVLLVTLRSHYLRIERDYLRSNGQAVAFNLVQLLEADLPSEDLQAWLDDFSFLSQTHIEFLDTQGQLVASSDRSGRRVIAILAGPEGRLPLPREAPADLQEAIRSLPLMLERARWLVQGEYLKRTLPARRGSEAEGAYSSQVVRLPVRGAEDQLLGFLELSQGPAYAREIVGDVAWGWGIASAVAVALAAMVGWLVSRRLSSPLLALTEVTTSMAGGDLAARADVARKDELGTLARSFNRMAEQVEDTVVTLRRFVSDAAHEIHTPLTALRTNLELATQDEYVAQAQAQVERLEALTGGLLDLSRIEADAGAQELGPLTLQPLVQDVGERYASRAEQAGLAFELSLPEGEVSVRGDEGQLRRALANLLDNALKFTPQGGCVHLGLRQDEGMAVLWVEDTGIGIPQEDLLHLFQRFHRGRNAAGYPGSGLGLAIVKAIAEGHAGLAQAERTEQGARFTLRIPLDQAQGTETGPLS